MQNLKNKKHLHTFENTPALVNAIHARASAQYTYAYKHQKLLFHDITCPEKLLYDIAEYRLFEFIIRIN